PGNPGAGAGLRHQPADRVGAYRDQPAHPPWWQGLDQRVPGPPADQEAGRDPDGFRQGLAGEVDHQREARSGAVRDELPERDDRTRGAAPRDPQAADEVPDRHPRGRGVLMASTTAAE